MTREQYLQQRKSTAQVFRRKSIAPGAFFLVSFIVMTWMKRNEMRPSTIHELVLHCLVLAVCVLSLVWFYVIGRSDDKLTAIHCSSCRKNINSPKASPWLMASGTCFYCHAKIFVEGSATMNSADGKPLISRAEYETKLKLTEAKLAKAALFVGAPLAIFLVWWAFLSGYPASMGSEPVKPNVMAILMGALMIIVGFMCYWESRINNQFGAKCANCRTLPRHHKKIVLATGGCTSCGHRIFEVTPSHSDSQMPVSALALPSAH
jgi:uncharacterized membrane protein YhaH (DUF805 family)